MANSKKHRKHRRRPSHRTQGRSHFGEDIEIQSLIIPSKAHRTRVEQNSNTAQTVSGIATFAGAITLSTQLLIECPNSRLQALLALASQLSLATPLVLLGVAAFIHGRAGDDPFKWDEGSPAFMVAQFMVSGIMLIASLLLLSCAIYVADVTHHKIVRWGLIMISLVMVILVVALWAVTPPTGFWEVSFFEYTSPAARDFALGQGPPAAVMASTRLCT